MSGCVLQCINTHIYVCSKFTLDISDRITTALATSHFQLIKKSITTSQALPYITTGLSDSYHNLMSPTKVKQNLWTFTPYGNA